MVRLYCKWWKDRDLDQAILQTYCPKQIFQNNLNTDITISALFQQKDIACLSLSLIHLHQKDPQHSHMKLSRQLCKECKSGQFS